MTRSEKVKKIVKLAAQLTLYLGAMSLIGNGEIGMLLGGVLGNKALQAIISIGILLIILPAIGFSFLFPTRRTLLLRETQIQVFKYLMWMVGFQFIGWGVLGVAGGGAAEAMKAFSPYVLQTLIMSMTFMGIGMPLKYVGQLFNQAKALQVRNPSDIIKQFYK